MENTEGTKLTKEAFIEELLKINPTYNTEVIEKAFVVADRLHEGQFRQSGDPYIIHPVNVAYILAKLGMDEDTIVGGLLHDVVEDTEYTEEQLIADFGEEICALVDGVTKLGNIKFASKENIQAENFRKMFLAMSKDIRVLVIKLADRLHNMRTLQYKSPEKIKEKSTETLEIYAPLAARLGIFSIKFELEDLSLKFLYPDVYEDLVHRISQMKTKKAEQQAEYRFAWQKEYVRRDARIDDGVLHLGTNNGYYDLTAETGVMICQLRDFTVSVHYKVSSENELDGYGHFLFAFSALAENSAHEGPYMAMRLNEQRFETSTGGYEHEEIIMTGDNPKRDVWHHAIYRQQAHKGELFIDGKLIGRNDRMPILAEIFKDAPANCWIGRAPFRGDKYLTQTDIADFRIYTYAVSDKDMRQLMKQAK